MQNSAEDSPRHRLLARENATDCPFCNKSFSYTSSLNFHMNIHTRLSAYYCKKCNKAFSHPSNLRMHRFMCYGEPQYNCSFCTRTFFQRSNRDRHEQSHPQKKAMKWNCTVPGCGKTFTLPQNRRRHIIGYHEGKRPYGCSKCNAVFGYPSTLYNHIRKRCKGSNPLFLERIQAANAHLGNVTWKLLPRGRVWNSTSHLLDTYKPKARTRMPLGRQRIRFPFDHPPHLRLTAQAPS